MRSTLILLLSVLPIFFCLPLEADDIAPGRVITITCKHDSSQRYSCYLPTTYTPTKKHPILYCFSPGADGRSFVRLYKDVCEKYGWIVVGSLNARNGPYGPIEAAIKAMWQDTHARFSISDTRCYSSGFSGGSGMAFRMADMYPEQFAGVIPMAVSTSWARRGVDIAKHIAVYFIIGSQDMVETVKTHAETLKQKGHKVYVNVFQGGHTLPPKEVAEAAVEWMEKEVPKRKSKRSSNSTSPLALKLEREVTKRLRIAAKKVEKGELGSALRIAKRVLEDENADDAETKDAEYIKTEVEKHLKALFEEVETLLKEGLAYDARQLLLEIKKFCNGTEYGKRAQDKIKEIDGDESLKDALAAGKLFARALKYESKGKKKYAKKYFRMVVERYPDTAYAEKARKKM